MAHNVAIILTYLNTKWTGNKLERLLGKKAFLKVPTTLAVTFITISKWATTYTKRGISRDWGDRKETFDVKHPHHMFLLQNLDSQVLFGSAAKLGKMYLPQKPDNVKEPWRQFFHIIPEGERPLAMSWIGWGDGTDVEPDGRKSTTDDHKKKFKKKKK